MSLFHLQCLKICLLNTELLIERSFLSAVKKYYFTSFLTSTVSDEKLQSFELLFPYKQCIIFFFYIQDFIVFLSLVLSNLTMPFLGMELCGCFLFGVCWPSWSVSLWGFVFIFWPNLGRFQPLFLHIFLLHHTLFSLSGYPRTWILDILLLYHRCLRFCSCLFLSLTQTE